MPRAEHNGADFHYIVEYKQLAENVLSESVVVPDWTVGELVVDNQPVFTAYEISVKAVNYMGSAPGNLLHVRIGHSGEDGLHVKKLSKLANKIFNAYTIADNVCTLYVNWTMVEIATTELMAI